MSEETKQKISNKLKSKEVQDKRKRTNKERYGDEIYQHSEHYKKYNRERFIEVSHTEKAINKKKENYRKKHGVEWPNKNPEVNERSKETQFKRYGCLYAQTKEFKEYMSELTSKNLSDQTQFSSCLRCYYDINGGSYFLRSSYEFIYALYLSVNDIDFEYEGLYIKYKDKEGLERYYKPDFMIGNKLVETKGYFPEEDKENFEFIKNACKEIGFELDILFYKDIKKIRKYLEDLGINIKYYIDLIRGFNGKEYYRFNFNEEVNKWQLQHR